MDETRVRLFEGERIISGEMTLKGMSESEREMELTAEQLIEYNGVDPSKPIYVAVKGRIFDVSNGKSFYGAGCPYAMFAGKDASRALAKGLSEKEIGVLTDWENKFVAKYPVVGRLLS